jgi:hypothetical protein
MASKLKIVENADKLKDSAVHIKDSAAHMERSTARVEDSADRRTASEGSPMSQRRGGRNEGKRAS